METQLRKEGTENILQCSEIITQALPGGKNEFFKRLCD
jgi:hypothetical protein